MGEVIRMPMPKPKGNISRTALGRLIIREEAAPVISDVLDAAKEDAPDNLTIEMDVSKNYNWAVVPLSDEKPKPPQLRIVKD